MNRNRFPLAHLQSLRIQIPNFLRDSGKLKRESQFIRKIRQPFSSRLECIQRVPQPGEPHKRRPTGPGRQNMKKPRPLQPLHDIQINNVHPIFPLKRFLYRLIRRKM
ncbi:hypothetical protein HanRHA438_Chr01g0000741 [Helianthus annuus]|nr:hypothetical protein HanIR_Chr01g0000821 [Helianthus annuus]KAJ0946143.1 hypothetical protein HanRHA438_Chr01g0000741 [Helianthus annuus]